MHTYNFAGTAGQRLFFDSLTAFSTAAQRLPGVLFAPDGDALLPIGTDALAETASIFLPVTGTYTLQFGGVNQEGELQTYHLGDYDFRVLNGAEQPLASFAVPTAGTLESGLTTHSYRVPAQAGQRLQFDALSNPGAGRWALHGPSGVVLQGADQPLGGDFTVPLAAEGTHFLVITGDQSVPIDYQFSITDVSDSPVSPEGFGDRQTGTVPAVNMVDIPFSGSAGQLVYYDGGFSFSLTATLIAPDGANLFTQAASDDSSVLVLPRSGTYTLRLTNATSSPNEYSFRILDLVSDSTALNFGASAAATLNPSDGVDVYRFEGAPGNLMLADAMDSNNRRLSSRVVSPSGVVRDAGPIVLQESGTHYLIISRNSLLNPDPSHFVRLERLAADTTEAVELPIAVSGTLEVGQEQRVYSFAGAAGAQFFANNSSAHPMRLIDARGRVLVDHPFNPTGLDFELPATGDYYLVVGAAAPSGTEFALRLAATLPNERTLDQAAGGAMPVTYTYDPTFSQMTSMTDELGRKTLYEIDPANGDVLSVTRVVGTVGGGDDLIARLTYLPNGLIDTVTDPLGRVTDYDYDTIGRLIKTIYAKGTADEGIRLLEYDLTGNLVAITDPVGNRSEFTYDVMNRVLRATQPDPDGTGPLTAPVFQWAYDAAGNLTETTDARNNRTRMEYDVRNRRSKVTDAQDLVTSFTYDGVGNPLSVADELGHVTRSFYDRRNRLVEKIDPDQGITRFSYDLDNNLVSLTDPTGNRTQFSYDARSRQVRQTDAIGKSTVNEFDAANQLKRTTDRMGRVVDYAYDDVGRRVLETWVSGGNVIEYEYDKASNILSLDDFFSSLTFTYDNRNRIKSVDNNGTPNVPPVVLTYDYDLASRLTSVVDSINGVAAGQNSYTHDALDRMVRLTQGGASVAPKRVDLVYNSLGQMAAIERFSGFAGSPQVVATSFTYDSLNRLTNLDHRNIADAIVNFQDLTYDAVDRITEISDVDGTIVYTYDNRDQLRSANYTDPSRIDEGYTYDANGHRLTSHLHNDGYETGPNNQLLSDGVFDYVYDDEGNISVRTDLATNSTRQFEWDFRNRLSAVIDRDHEGNEVQRVDFSYDAMNRRISKSVVGATPSLLTHFVYDRDDVLLDFTDPDGAMGSDPATLTQRYLHGPVVDQVFAQESASGETLWHLSDHLGTVRDLVDSTGAVVNHFAYDSYGNVVAESNPAESTRYRFTGRELDLETGLHYYRSRFYDSLIGKFLSEDPIGFWGGQTDLYQYVGNRPVGMIDPTGTTNLVAYSAIMPIGPGGAHESIILTNTDTGEMYMFAAAPSNGENGTWNEARSGEPITGVFSGDIRSIFVEPGLTFEQAKKRLEKFKEQVNCAKRPYSMLPGWGWLGEHLGVPNTYDPRAMTSDTVSADAKRLLGGSGLPFATNGIPYYLPGTERSYLAPPTPSARSDAPWDRFPHMR